MTVLLHEAAHVAQWRQGVNFTAPNHWFEHDAECRALKALPKALRTLHYTRGMAASATSVFRSDVKHEPEPYGGDC